MEEDKPIQSRFSRVIGQESRCLNVSDEAGNIHLPSDFTQKLAYINADAIGE
jgi:hypothetical protein